jgi:hypothetical protein
MRHAVILLLYVSLGCTSIAESPGTRQAAHAPRQGDERTPPPPLDGQVTPETVPIADNDTSSESRPDGSTVQDESTPQEDTQRTPPSDVSSDAMDSERSPAPDKDTKPIRPAEQLLCLKACESAADCGTEAPGPGAYGPEEYLCTDGACRYGGCASDADCAVTFQSDTYVCAPTSAGPQCLIQCASWTDCGLPSDPDGGAYAASNYLCTNGACQYQGCQKDAECQATFAGFGLPYVCADGECVRACETEIDCATDEGAFSAQNYTCEEKGCRWLGCTSDAECSVTFQSEISGIPVLCIEP